ncbi:MAG: hypothetical protein JW806_07510 [Sedimentisphaerales bacterium]|nr:hypothetical protein [Sedimentisphaerales bacterium]
MFLRRMLKLIHFSGAIWLIACIGYILTLALRQAGIEWWVIFSFSGHSILILLLLTSLYLFIIFREISRTQLSIEHPLTSAYYYLFLYDISPFLGALAGFIGMAGTQVVHEFLLGIALGTLGATFLSWIIIDPIAGFLEMLLPASRAHRTARLAEAKKTRQEMQENRERLLAEVLSNEESNRQLWQKTLLPDAERLAEILISNKMNFQTECEIAKIGVKTCQIGGLSCMRHLHDMAMNICKDKKRQNIPIVDYISVYWDGIGNWQCQPLPEMIAF